ncbi:Sugar transferase involved in lipopolysaccharidesynthesis [Halalkaliarchaeum sp. AArc-CO]|uniref:sugar transferase n=1 Tax=Halalkaliarchaeum sp. AArc-CO TaxID=2866381 RepID=UPI00217E11E6|nr:Sugar transferase involved in lipopolysaccharidesynthesis [Halalkaliarchaeum sp. AArc-CO]
MLSGWRYRIASATGVICLTAGALLVANHPTAQLLFTTYVPLFNRLDPTVLTGAELQLALLLSVVAIGGALVPLYKPRPRRILDTVFFAQKRVLVGGLALATLGYFRWSYRHPRATLTMMVGALLVAIPLWFVWIRRRPTSDPERTLLVGDDPGQLERIVTETEHPFVGYLAPTAVFGGEEEAENAIPAPPRADGGVQADLEHLGGLSRLEDALVERDIDAVVLAFRQPDRAEFFGALDACYEHGVAAKVHREYADSVLTAEDSLGTLVDVEVEPWDIQDYALKRAFDVAFAGSALLALSPVILLIALAIKLEGEGPVLFSQKRTYLFGETFTVYKFRTLKPDPEGEVGTTIDDNRETPLGNFLRTTHLDEIPQLWSILVGDMSVVGPRPAQTDLESDFEAEADHWRHRWFVKPGLTGLAQINDATSQEPREKIQYDIQYIRTQSFTGDLKIVFRQFWQVGTDVFELVIGQDSDDE